MWLNWFPWKFLIRLAARKQGFLDPFKVLAQLQNFAQPSEVTVPTELLRSGVLLHARGLINSLAIQHNLDWVWPYWIERQYDPLNQAFIPRAFSLTQINLTHRNWTAVGVPDDNQYPLIDPAGLLTPLYDGWSIDAWIIPVAGSPLIPSRNAEIKQEIKMDGNLSVLTQAAHHDLKLKLQAQSVGCAQAAVCQLKITASSASPADLVVSLRPYNPEGISFINKISVLEEAPGWKINGEKIVYFDRDPKGYSFSDYLSGDVYGQLGQSGKDKEVSCKVGLASAAAIFPLAAGKDLEINLWAPLRESKVKKDCSLPNQKTAEDLWKNSLEGVCKLRIPDKHLQFLYENAIHTMILHSPKEIYPGPYIYRRFWFRDAALILNSLLMAGLTGRAKRALDCFSSRQTVQGYFLSQEGEWDSNGEALWAMQQYCLLTGQPAPEEWKKMIFKAARWICRKLLPAEIPCQHAGLLPSGFSAEHLGPNDFYYWDDFWAVAGLEAGAFFANAYGDKEKSGFFDLQKKYLLKNIEGSLSHAQARIKSQAIPASVYRRMDSGAIGSLVASFPLQIFEANDKRILETAEFLIRNCLIDGGFFHDMTHSGINPYLSLHLAQVLLRAGDRRYLGLMEAIARIATPTGQWPESIHPRTGGGCMGDGEHVWAAAEWFFMIRNCFVREEKDRLILCSGLPGQWLNENQTLYFGQAPTRFGRIEITVKPENRDVLVEWKGQWFAGEPRIEVRLPDFTAVEGGSGWLRLKKDEQ